MKSLQKLTRYRWCIPALAELRRLDGAKFITLVRRLKASDKAVRQSLDYLIEEGLVMRNPGYGHPLRPEYILTEEGDPVASDCLRLVEEYEAPPIDRWSLPILAQLSAGSLRNSDLKSALSPITARSLALALQQLEELGLVVRHVSNERPIAVSYSLTSRGKALSELLVRLG